MAFGNRVPSSLARLSQAKEAPSAIRWGRYDRSALVRIPVVPAGASGRPVAEPTVEFRLPDGSAMAHLLLAGIVQAMIAARGERDLTGLIDATSIRPPKGSVVPVEPLPSDFAAVGLALDRHREPLEAGGVFPRDLLDAVIARLGGG